MAQYQQSIPDEEEREKLTLAGVRRRHDERMAAEGWEPAPVDSGWEVDPTYEGWEEDPTFVSPDQQAYNDANIAEKLQLGIVQSVTEAGIGIDDYLNSDPGGSFRQTAPFPFPSGGLRLSTQAQRDMLDRERGVEGGWKTTGEIIGDVGMLMAGGAPLAGAKAVRAAPLLADAALVGGLEGTKLPEEGESRLGNATIGAAATLATGGLVKALAAGGRAYRGKNLTPKRQGQLDTLQEQGLKTTPGQYYGGTVGTLENAAATVNPAANKAVIAAREASDLPLKSAWAEPPVATAPINQAGIVNAASKVLPKEFGEAVAAHPYLAAGAAALLTPLTVKQLVIAGVANSVGGRLVFSNALRQRLVGLAGPEQAVLLNQIINSVPTGGVANQFIPDQYRQMPQQPSRQQMMANALRQQQGPVQQAVEQTNRYLEEEDEFPWNP
jgi:hypothetical protein